MDLLPDEKRLIESDVFILLKSFISLDHPTASRSSSWLPPPSLGQFQLLLSNCEEEEEEEAHLWQGWCLGSLEQRVFVGSLIFPNRCWHCRCHHPTGHCWSLLPGDNNSSAGVGPAQGSQWAGEAENTTLRVTQSNVRLISKENK